MPYLCIRELGRDESRVSRAKGRDERWGDIEEGRVGKEGTGFQRRGWRCGRRGGKGGSEWGEK